jgi:hypothetical protein
MAKAEISSEISRKLTGGAVHRVAQLLKRRPVALNGKFLVKFLWGDLGPELPALLHLQKTSVTCVNVTASLNIEKWRERAQRYLGLYNGCGHDCVHCFFTNKFISLGTLRLG